MSRFKFSVGPWNVHEGADALVLREESILLVEKIKKFGDGLT